MQEQKAIFDHLVSTYPEFAKGWYHLGHWHSHLDDLPEFDLDVLLADAAAAFEEALRLDPFNARMVGAILTWYRDRGYQDEVTRLSERMNQIIPETAADRRLARVSWHFKRRQIRSAFRETADESWIEEYRNAWQEAVESGDYLSPVLQYLDEIELSVYVGDKDRLVELSQLPIDHTESERNPLAFSLIKPLGMQILADRGELDQAHVLARSILEQEEVLVAQDLSDCPCYLGALAHANAVLGQDDEARRWSEALAGQPQEDRLDAIDASAYVDLELAVESAFAELVQNPNWDGFDEMAAEYIWYRRLLAHPRVQEYYVNEGKWIDYLSARVPEYARYVREATQK